MTKPTISLCMIVKDFTLELENELKNLWSFVDEIVIATQDKPWVTRCKTHPNLSGVGFTPDAPGMGSNRHNLNVYHYEWQNDFAAARNNTFDKATSDYIFWIDSDDTVLHPEKLSELVERMATQGIDWCNLEYLYEKDELGRVRLRQWKPRITRRGTGTWVGTIHETYQATEAVKQINSDDIVIDHQHGGAEHMARSAERNLGILMAEYARDGDKTDPRTLYYLGHTMMAMGRFPEAINFYLKHIDQCGWPEEKYFSIHYAAHCYSFIGKYESAITLTFEMMRLFPSWSLAHYDLAEYYSMKNDVIKVIEWTLTGMTKERPDVKAYFSADLDYEVTPKLRLIHAYILARQYPAAVQLARQLLQANPTDPLVIEVGKLATDALEVEDFVQAFLKVVYTIRTKDRIKGQKLFDVLPNGLDEDARIQQARFASVPPKMWDAQSIVIYCGRGNGVEWAQPSIYTGIGGSEEAVIYMSEELTKLGYQVTVYNHCGDFRGVHNGVTYVPYYHFNLNDNFNVLVSWRTPGLFDQDVKAKKKLLWLHDIAYPQHFNQKIIDTCDKIIFLSKWHRSNLPEVPEEKVFISNNGINPADFKDLPAKEPNTLLWSSSYDRGLLPFIKNILPLIKKEIPDVVLHVAYGWNNIKKLIDEQPGIYLELEALYNELAPILNNTPGIVHHGRIGHKALAQLMGKCMVYPYASEFGETNNITSQKMQAAGCYVITTSQAGGTPERVKYGRVVQGDGIYADEKLQKKYAAAVIESLTRFKRIKAFTDVNADLKTEFSWKTTAKTWKEGLL